MGRALRRQLFADGLARCVALLVALATLQFLLDRFLLLGIGPRISLLALVIGLLGREFIRRVLKPMTVVVDAESVAEVLEHRQPELADRLVSMVAFAGQSGFDPARNSPALIDAILVESLRDFETLPTINILRRGPFIKRVALAACALSAAVAASAVLPGSVAAYLKRNWLLRDVSWPVSTQIVAEGFKDGKLVWPLGDDLTIVASTEGKAPSALAAEFEIASGSTVQQAMDRLGESRFIYDYGPLSQAMRVRFVIDQWGVDERTDWFDVVTVERPTVRSVTIEVTPPAYTGEVGFTLARGQTVADMVRGSEVRIIAEMNKPVVQAALKRRADDVIVAAADVTHPTHLTTRFVPEGRGTYFFDVRDESGLEDRSPVTYTFNLAADPPPSVKLSLPGVGEMVVPNAQLRLAVEGDDNLGIEAVALRYEIKYESAEPLIDFEALPDFTAGQRKYAATHVWPLMPLALKPGDQLTLQATARDFQPAAVSTIIPSDSASETSQPGSTSPGDRGPPSNLGLSIAYTLRVATAEDLLAELGRRENEWRREFELVVKAQEQMSARVSALRTAPEPEAMSAQRQLAYGQEARTQRQQLSRVRTILRQFEQILAELEVNELTTPQVRRRLGNGVIAPLRTLVGGEIEAAASLLERLRDRFEVKTADEVQEAQKQLLRAMNAILAAMLKWEGYNEAVALVREIVRLQQEVNEDTREKLDREIERLFGDTPSPATQPAIEEHP